MKQVGISGLLWGNKAKLRYLFIVACCLLFAWLGGREIWTQEHRWADIVAGMFLRQDYFHPYLGDAMYYDKPLLSYWLMAAIAALTGGLSTWALRLPSAMAGLLAIWSIYKLGASLKDKQLGFLSAWMLLTTFYFLFWARVSSADMLNMAGSLFAVTWYTEKREQADFSDYAIFFLIVALTSLCKGLVGAVIPAIAVITDVALRQTWRRYLTWTLAVSMVPALIVYVTPFLISSMTGQGLYGENGLYLVYRENVLRYFQPFDHQGPLYTYLIYLPVYTLPWAIFLIPALYSAVSRWRRLTIASRWVVLTVVFLFAFFTFSGSRRSYYVLPLVPFTILMIADWLCSSSMWAKRCLRWSASIVLVMVCLMLVIVDYLPVWYNQHYGIARFASDIVTMAGKPLNSENVLMLDAESKLYFYLNLPPTIKNHSLPVDRNNLSDIEKWRPVLQQHAGENIVVMTRKQYLPYVQPYFQRHRVIDAPVLTFPGTTFTIENDSAALIPIYTK